MKVSVVVITKNQKELLQQSLPTLLKQKLNGKYEIIVVDSGSVDGAKGYIKSLPVKLIEIPSQKFRFARAFNIGAKHAKGEFLVRLSGDAVPRKDNFLAEMIEPFKDIAVGGTYGRYIQTGKRGYSHPNFWPPERFPDRTIRFSKKPSFFNTYFGKNNRNRGIVTSFAGACCAIRRKMWLKRHFNENLMGGEDAEYATYLHLKGLDIVYNPKAEVVHEHKIENLDAGFYIENAWRIIFLWEYLKLFIKGH